MNFLVKAFNKLKYGLLALLLMPFCVGFVNATDDLMRQIMEPAHDLGVTLDLGKSVSKVGKNVLEGNMEFNADTEGLRIRNGPSIIVRVTRVLLGLVVALSITMILYNGLSYIIQTGQGKEGKDLVKNVVYIVIGILLSLFSVTIITLLQSVSTTLKEDTTPDRNQIIDDGVVNGGKKGLYWRDLFNHNTQTDKS